MCEVFFFGTARNTDSHRPARDAGMLRWMAAGMAKLSAESPGTSCLEKRRAAPVKEEEAGAARRGRKEERMEVVVAWTAAIVVNLK